MNVLKYWPRKNYSNNRCATAKEHTVVSMLQDCPFCVQKVFLLKFLRLWSHVLRLFIEAFMIGPVALLTSVPLFIQWSIS